MPDFLFRGSFAEGYPDEDTRRMAQVDLLDQAARLAEYRRYSDPRYYKGVEYADIVEALARRRCAEIFTANGLSPEDIYVNVQPLSGAPANNAVYHALLQPGDPVMGLDLLHGGHLTHGSPVNRSGKYYRIVPYGVHPQTERLDYDAIEALARAQRPKLIIAGFTSYPWSPDWARFRAIADSVGAYLLADIAHVAGLVVAGVCPSPLGIADVVTFTTHKSLCGPRGAVILTTSPRLSRLVDRAVFPGEQGGPHVNTIAAQAVAFKLAATNEFKQLQRQIVVNCVALTDALARAGFRIPFGGTDTHLTNLDCKTIVGADGTFLSGDQAARILDLAGIVVNRNTIHGDVSAGGASGIRLGTPWVTQRGFQEPQIEELAGMIAEVLRACRPYSAWVRGSLQHRAKVDFQVLNATRIRVRDLAQSMGIDFEPTEHGYPHFWYLDDAAPKARLAAITVEGARAEAFLGWATSASPEEMAAGDTVNCEVHVAGKPIQATLSRGSDVNLWRLGAAGGDVPRLLGWLRDLSDGYVDLDPQDLQRKLPGPVVVRLDGRPAGSSRAASDAPGDDKPWFIGATAVDGEGPGDLRWVEAEGNELRRTPLFEAHKALGAKMVPFAGWEMPVWYTSVLEEHVATREAAGLFDVSHMGVYQAEGRQACAFLDSVVANDVVALDVGESLYSQFLDADGAVIDDTMIYRLREYVYMVVVNAANDDKDRTWLEGVLEGRYCVDRERPRAKALGRTSLLRNLRDARQGDAMRVDLALQGPKSREILLALGCDAGTKAQLLALPWAGVMEAVLGGFDLVISRTGYTGERLAFELFIHPDRLVELWEALLRVGKPLGLKPVGLGARDSLRTEAGLPLYGHEMAGEMGLGVGDAGFASYVKAYRPWFVGRKAFLAQEAKREGEVVRFRFNEKGVRMAHYGDPVVDRRGTVIGRVTSCAVDREGYLLGQAYVQRRFTAQGAPIAVFQSASKQADKAPAELGIGDRVSIPTPATVLSRFRR